MQVAITAEGPTRVVTVTDLTAHEALPVDAAQDKGQSPRPTFASPQSLQVHAHFAGGTSMEQRERCAFLHGILIEIVVCRRERGRVGALEWRGHLRPRDGQ